MYEQTQVFYTQDDVDTLNKSNAEHTEIRVQRALDSLNADHAERTLKVIRELVDNGIIDNTDTAIEVYNAIASELGWTTITSLTRKFTVSVSYDGHTIAEFEDVEAMDEEEASMEVLENMEVEASLSMTLTYNGESGDYSYELSEWDLDTDRFSTDVVEQ